MSTQIQENITDTWLDIKASLSLALGVTYLIQNVGTGRVMLNESPTPPVPELRGHVIEMLDFSSFTISTDNMYVSCAKGNGAIAVTET